MPHELPNDLRLRILRNKKIGKSQIWVETQHSAQTPFQKLNSVNSSQKRRKSRYQTFLVLSRFTGFLHFARNILSMIVGRKMCVGMGVSIFHFFEWRGVVSLPIIRVLKLGNYISGYFNGNSFTSRAEKDKKSPAQVASFCNLL